MTNLLLAACFSMAMAAEVTMFSNMCYPCVSQGNFFCPGDLKCYDSTSGGCSTLWVNGRTNLCADINIGYSAVCNALTTNVNPFQIYNRFFYLEPRSACQFRINGAQSYAEFKDYAWPLQLFHNGHYMTTYKDDDYGASINTTDTTFKITAEFNYLYFYIINWDYSQTQTVEVEVMQTDPSTSAMFLRNSLFLAAGAAFALVFL